MPRLTLKLFGSIAVSLDDQEVAGFRTNKVQALLVYLVTEPEAHRRESLMELLWPGMPEHSARHNLRQILYQLRIAIPELVAGDESVDAVLANRQSIQLNPAAEVDVDVHRFEGLLDATQSHEHVELSLCQHCRENLEQAVTLYEGDFLADFYLDDSNVYENWSQARRQAYRRQVLDALEILTTMQVRRAEYGEARDYAERQLSIDNLREGAHRQLMEIMALSGRREEALAVYEKARRILAEDLAMAPSKRTTKLYEQIAAGDLSFKTPATQGIRGYELKDEIGEGAYGTIHRAIQPSVGREVAVKIIRRKLANDAEFIRRFEAEAQTIAMLEHPFIVPLYDYWRDPDGAYLVMRYMRGGSLLSSLASGPWKVAPAAGMLDQIADALDTAHRRGIIHRDIKPANILLDEAGNAFLSDFGIAKDLGKPQGMTLEGAVIGTPDYISPEQILAEEITPQTDVYSLGAVLYETLTGEKPFPDSSVANLIYKHLNEPLPLVGNSRPDLPAEIDRVIQRATAKRPVDRYASALEMSEAYRRAVQGDDASVIQTGPTIRPEVAEIYNPYKGLRAFQEADADDFFGREALVQQLIRRLDPDKTTSERFLAVVGPSGSGKSSAIKAGLIPALRAGAIAGSDKWFVADMVPGTHPLEELELALWPVAVDPPPSLVEPMQRDSRGLLRTIRRILPDEPDAQLLLIIDQFEELFTLVDDEERRDFFIDSLLQAIAAPRSPLRVVITLRADFYDRPLQYDSLGRLIKDNTEIVLPLTTEELTWSIREPARRVGVGLERGLSEAIIGDVTDQPGALPLLQYALTELFERRQDGQLTRAAYGEIGGVLGALGRRADEIYEGLDTVGQEAARQLFLRLVMLGEGAEDTRRRVLRTELESLTGSGQRSVDSDQTDVIVSGSQIPDPGSPIPEADNMSAVIDLFGRARLLTFDHDPLTRRPTVEVAHEALLREWRPLRHWLARSRDEVRLQRALAQAAAEWSGAGQDDSYLLRGSRLAQFEGWAEDSTISLTQDEQSFLATSVAARAARQAEEEVRLQRELKAAQRLAETERARAEEQSDSAKTLRRRAVFLSGAVVVAAVLAIAAVFFARQSYQNAEAVGAEAGQRATAQAQAEEQRVVALAEAESRATAQAAAEASEAEAIAQQATAQAEADFRATAEVVAVQEREAAEVQAALAASRELAAAAISNLDVDPERSALLAVAALDSSYSLEAEQALHVAVPRLRVLQTFYGHEDHINGVTFSPNGDRLATASSDGTARVWDTGTGEELFVLSGHEARLNGLFFSPDGTMVATASDDGTVRIWDASLGQTLLVLDDHKYNINLELANETPAVTNVLFNPDGSTLVTSSNDGTIKTWDVATGQPLSTIFTNGHIIGPMAFDRDGSRLAIAGSDGFAAVVNVATGETEIQLSGYEPTFWVDGIAFDPQGTRLLTTSDDQTARIWDATTGEELDRFFVGDSTASTLSPDGSRFVTTGLDGVTRIWDAATGRTLLTLTGHQDRVWQAVYSPDGLQVATASADGTAKLWDLSPEHELLTLLPFPDSALQDLSALAVSPDGSLLAAGGFAGGISLRDLEAGREIIELAGHDDFVGGLNFSPDGQLIVSAADDRTVKIWDVRTGALRLTLEEPDGLINDVLFSPDASLVAGVGTDQYAAVWDAESGDILFTLPLEEWAWGVSFSPDGLTLATGDLAGNIVLWEASDGRLLNQFVYDPERANATYRLAFTPDGDRLVVAGLDGMVKVLDTQTGKLLQTIKAHQSLIWGMDLSLDGRTLATAAGDGTARLWDLATGNRLLTLTGHSGPLTDVAFNHDSTHLVSASRDGTARVYTLDLSELLALAQTRVTRTLTDEECQQYLHLEACPE